ncbi:MAG TPA: sulfatase-like hydrolase/transferase [Thermoanaerobaculia bacterium]|nr:sulfatase-like hydrolase/transferase [Thermoanaerobaculia bacterium]
MPLFLFLACGGGPSGDRRHDGPIVLITFSSLRADVVGGLGGESGLTPQLDALIRQADWSGRAVAASSWGAPAMASLLTGLRPWQHQLLHAGSPPLSPDLLTLAEALKAAGYTTAAYPSGSWYTKEHGFAQGFDVFEAGGKGRDGAEALQRLGVRREGREGRELVWIHVPEPQAPYVLRRRLLSRLQGGPRELPARIRPLQLEAFFDPGVPLPEARRQRLWDMYLLNVAWADEKLGRLLEALRASGQWDRTLLVVTADHGEEFREQGQMGRGGNLGRQLLEVPLVVKLPAGSGLQLRAPEGEHAGAARLWATLVEAAGGPVPPAVAPSLFRPVAPPVLSELYLTNGLNRFSLVQGNDQLLWDSRFAPPEPDYYRARLRALAGEAARPPLVLDRLERAFDATPPLQGRGQPSLRLERWGERESLPATDPQRTAEMARRLAEAWKSFACGDLPPGEEARHRTPQLPL